MTPVSASARAPGGATARPSPGTRRWLVMAVVTLTAAVFVAPLPVAEWSLGRPRAGIGTVQAAVGSALGQGWTGSAGSMVSHLGDLVALWERFHLVKAVLCAAWLAALGALARDLRGRRGPGIGATGPSRSRWAAGGAVLTELTAALALVMLVANLQGALAPLASTVSLASGSRDPSLAAAAGHAASTLRAGYAAAPTQEILEAFAAYHRVMVGLGGLMVAFAVAGLWWAWRRRGRRVRRGGVRWPSFALGLWGLAFGLVTFANLTTARSPAPALAAFLDTLG